MKVGLFMLVIGFVAVLALAPGAGAQTQDPPAPGQDIPTGETGVKAQDTPDQAAAPGPIETGDTGAGAEDDIDPYVIDPSRASGATSRDGSNGNKPELSGDYRSRSGRYRDRHRVGGKVGVPF